MAARIITAQLGAPISGQRNHRVIAVGIADAVGIILVSVLVVTMNAEPRQWIAEIILDTAVKHGGSFKQENVHARHAAGGGNYLKRVTHDVTMQGCVLLLRFDFPTAGSDRRVEIAIGVGETERHKAVAGLQKHQNAGQRRVGVAPFRHPS